MPYTLRTVSTVTVNVQQNTTTDPGAWGNWEVVASGPFGATDYTEAGIGDATLGSVVDIYEGRKYEIEFYPENGYATPTASPITADATSQEFLGDYLSSSGTRLAVQIVGAPQTTTWELTGPSYPTGFSGTGDMPAANVDPGSYTITWGWQHYAATPVPYPWQETKVVAVDSITTFDTPYIPRSAPALTALPMGTNIQSDGYYTATYVCANILNGSENFRTISDRTVVTSPIDGNGWPLSLAEGVESICQTHGNGRFGLQTFHMFWKGHGTIQMRGQQLSGIREDTELLASNGEAGITFELYIDPPKDYDPWNYTDGENGQGQSTRSYFRIISTDPSDHLRDVEVVHEDCIVVPIEKAFRSVEPGNTYLDSDFHKNYEQFRLLRPMSHIDDVRYANQYSESLTGEDESRRENVDYEAIGRTMDTKAYKSWSTVRHARQMYIDICNAAGKDYWCCFSHFDNDDHVKDVIDQIEAEYTGLVGGGLHPDRTVWIEYGNENWNTYYVGYDYGQYWGMWHAGNWVDQFGRPFPGRTQGIRATPTPGFEDVTFTNPVNCERRYTSYRTWKLKLAYESNALFAAKVSAGVYGSLADRVKVVCPGFAAGGNLENIRFSEDTWPSYEQPAISFDGGSTNFVDHVDYYAPQLYSSIDNKELGGGEHGDRAPWPPARADYESRAQEYFDTWLQWQIDNEWPLLDARAELATKWGMGLSAYEVGQHVVGSDLDGDFLYYVIKHPRMYQIYTELYKKWHAIGGVMPVNFTSPGRFAAYRGGAFWPLRETYYTEDHESYRWMAFVDWSFNNTLEPGGPGPTPDPTETITVVVDNPAGASWSISPDPGGGNGSGSTSKAFQALLDDYTITWNDTAISSSVNTPDSSNGPITLTVGNPITWTASDFYTTLTTGEINVDIQKSGGAESGTEGWTIAGSDPFDDTDFFETGAGDTGAGGATGPFYDGRDYVVSYASEGANWVTPAPDVVTCDDAVPQTAIGNYTVTAPPPTVGVPHDIYWIGHSLTQDNQRQAVKSIANDLGFPTTTDGSIIPGAPLKWQWCPQKDFQGNPISNPNCDIQYSRARLDLTAGGYDTLIMTTSSPLDNNPADNKTYASAFLNLQRQKFNGDIYMWETWENRSGVTTWPDEAWRANLLSEASRWQEITDAVNAGQSGTDMRRIRGGSIFWVELYDELFADNITGFDKLHEFFKPNDTIHHNDFGAYFDALIIVAELFQTPVGAASNQIYNLYGNPWPASSTLSTTTANELQAIVDGITGYT